MKKPRSFATAAIVGAVVATLGGGPAAGGDTPGQPPGDNVNHVTFDPSLAQFDSTGCQIGDGFELSREVDGLTAQIMAIDTSGPHLVYSIEVSWDGTNTGLAAELSQNGASAQSNGSATMNLTALTAPNNFWAIVDVTTPRGNVNNPIVIDYPQHVEVTFGPCVQSITTPPTTSPPAPSSPPVAPPPPSPSSAPQPPSTAPSSAPIGTTSMTATPSVPAASSSSGGLPAPIQNSEGTVLPEIQPGPTTAGNG